MDTDSDTYCRFPYREGNRFSLLVDGENFFTSIYDDIHNATQLVCVEIYLMESGKAADTLIDALIKAVKRNVQVFLMVDAFGSRKLSNRDLGRLKQNGVKVSVYNPFRFTQFKRSLHRTHRKIIVIDQRIAYTGGAGFTDTFLPQENPDNYWQDVMVRIEGPCVQDWQTLFSENWSQWSNETAPALTQDVEQVGSARGRVVANRSLTRSEIRRSLIQRIRKAKTRIWIATPYFVPSRKLRRLLMKAVQQNIDTRLLLAGPVTDNPGSRYMARRYYTKLLKAGVKIYEYKPRFMHAKIFFVDDWVSVGSTNLEKWGLIWNLDANQETDDEIFIDKINSFYNEDFSHSNLFEYQLWASRPWKTRLLEFFWGKVVTVLSWFSSDVKELKK